MPKRTVVLPRLIIALSSFGFMIAHHQAVACSSTISNSGTSSTILQDGFGTSGTCFVNTGTLNTDLAFMVYGTNTTITNSGVVNAMRGGDGTWFYNGSYGASVISLVNSGTINVASAGKGISVYSQNSIGTLTNTGTINHNSANAGSRGIDNGGTITTLNNSQGGLSVAALNFSGNAPTNYNIIIN